MSKSFDDLQKEERGLINKNPFVVAVTSFEGDHIITYYFHNKNMDHVLSVLKSTFTEIEDKDQEPTQYEKEIGRYAQRKLLEQLEELREDNTNE